MINQFGERLVTARKMAGMSMDSLARKAGGIVSKQAISKYEKGLINPGSEVVLALAKALDVKVDYFFRPPAFVISGIEFRKRSRLGKKEEERIKYQTIDFIQKYLEVEEILNACQDFKNPVTNHHIKTLDDIEAAPNEGDAKFLIRSQCKGHCGKIFQAVKVAALPLTIQEVK